VTRVRFLSRAVCLSAIFSLLLQENLSAFETMRGYVRLTEFPSCINRCDILFLEPDSGFSLVSLTKDLNSTVNLSNYIDMHVELTGFRAGCGGCVDLYVSSVQVLNPDGVADEHFLPGGTLLRQNYPNPFNPATMIEYSLKTDANVTLTVFDLLGRQVSTLAASRQHAGVYRIAWDAHEQPDGIYFYRLIASGRELAPLIQTRAMLLLR
jgi:type IX secretion system substrate protein